MKFLNLFNLPASTLNAVKPYREYRRRVFRLSAVFSMTKGPELVLGFFNFWWIELYNYDFSASKKEFTFCRLFP